LEPFASSSRNNEALADLSLVSKRYNEEYFSSEKVGEIRIIVLNTDFSNPASIDLG
jgi:hypothetical protein